LASVPSNFMMRTATFLTILACGRAQTPDAKLQFEVASIKPSVADSGRMRISVHGGPGTKDPGLYTCENYPLPGLIRDAFGLKEYQLSGPDWMQSTHFMVSAKVPEGTSREQFNLMMQNLLIERFKLAFHREKKEMQAYELVVAKGGPKMKESESPLDPDERPARMTERKTDAEGFPVLPPGRAPMMMMLAGGHATARHTAETMEEFAVSLSMLVHKPVTDTTGLSGKYDFILNWIEEGMGGPSATDEAGPTLFRALPEQLGLRLESKKGMVEILVVDHVEKTPTAN
jgi:uncharacterized protein (TIGR03435 family)